MPCDDYQLFHEKKNCSARFCAIFSAQKHKTRVKCFNSIYSFEKIAGKLFGCVSELENELEVFLPLNIKHRRIYSIKLSPNK